MAAQHAQTAGWFARFSEAAPSAVLGAVLLAVFGFLGWIAVSLVDLRSDVKALDARATALETRVTALETRVEKGFEQTDERLTRLETRMDDIYKLLLERLPPPPEQNPPQR